MRRIADFFIAVKSLGVFGLILVLSVAIIGWFAFNVLRLDAAIDRVHQEAEKRNSVEDVEFFLFQLEWEEKYFMLKGDRTYAEWYNEDAGLIDNYIAKLLAMRISTSEKEAIDELARRYQEYQQTFAEIVAAADAGNWDEARHLHDTASAEKTGHMHEQIEDLIFEAEATFEEAIQRANWQGRQTVLGGVIGLIVLPFLAVWAFGMASRITQPVLTLTNAVVAIEGNQFRSDLLTDVIDRHDGLGRLAQALEQMAQKVKAREENLEHELKELHGQFHEARRRKLLPTTRQSTSEH